MNPATRLSRRTFVGAGGASAAALLAGCGMTAGGNSKSMTFLNDSDLKNTPFEKVIETFQKKSGITVDVQPVPSDYDTKFRTVLSSGKPPDLLRINDDYVKGFSKTGALMDLNKYIKQDKLDTSHFQPAVYNYPKQPDGSHTAWVIAHSPRLFYYNVDMFKQAGVALPPTTWTSKGWTWSDFLDTAKKLTVKGKQYGALVYLDTGYEQTFSINNGSPTGIFSKDGKTFTLSDPKAAEAVQWAADLTCKYHVQPAWGDLQSTDADLQLFTQGKLGMMFSTFQSMPYLLENVKDFTFDVAPPPAGPAGQKTESSVIPYAIPAKAGNPDAAWKLLKFLTGEEAGKIFMEGNMWIPMDERDLKYLHSPPAHVQLFADAVKNSILPNQTNNTLGARDVYRPMLEDVYNCNKKAADVLAAAKPQVDQALQKQG